MKQLNIILAIFGFLLIGYTFGQAPKGFTEIVDKESFKKKVKETSEQTQSISSDFIQEKYLTMMEEVLVSNGRFLFKKENKVKWQYLDPIVYAIIINQNRFTINNDGKISEFDIESNKLFKEINNMIVMAIQGDFVDNPDFSAKFYQDEKRYLAILVPQNELLVDILSQIEIYFLKENTAVDEVIFVEPGDDFTKIVFKNRKANIKISDEQFGTK
jgi:outer membrane lipoprotein carrier protein